MLILRKGSGYHSKELKEKYCSATGFRSFYESFAQTKQILSFDRLNEHFKDLLPETSLKILFDAFGKTPKILLGEDKNSETEEYSKFISLPSQK